MSTGEAAVQPAASSKAVLGFAGVAAALLIAFAKPVLGLARFAAGDSLFSYILWIPILVPGLIWAKRTEIRWPALERSPAAALGCAAVGLALCSGVWLKSTALEAREALPWLIGALVVFLFADGFFFFGTRTIRVVLWPAAILFCAIPFPPALTAWLETGLQWSSALAAGVLFHLFRTPVSREGTILHLPRIDLEVAQECSGIHSTVVLLLTSLIAAYLFLHRPRFRAILIAAVLPIGILRNAFRIFVIGMLCAHLDPAWGQSWIHLRGGPVFFVGSLVILVTLVWWLRQREMSTEAGGGAISRRTPGLNHYADLPSH